MPQNEQDYGNIDETISCHAALYDIYFICFRFYLQPRSNLVKPNLINWRPLGETGNSRAHSSPFFSSGQPRHLLLAAFHLLTTRRRSWSFFCTTCIRTSTEEYFVLHLEFPWNSLTLPLRINISCYFRACGYVLAYLRHDIYNLLNFFYLFVWNCTTIQRLSSSMRDN